MTGDRLDGFEQVTEWLRDAPTVETVYGDPVERDDRTVLPVAEVRYRVAGGFGWGEGSGAADSREGESSGGGGGGMGGARVTPLGALDVCDEGTEFVRFETESRRAAVVAAVLGGVLGVALGRRWR